MKVVIVSALLFSSLALAQETKVKTPPVPTDAQKMAFFKANSEFQAANSQAQQAMAAVPPKKAALDDAIKSITEACGKDFQPTIDAQGYPACVANPAPVKPAGKPVEPKK